jgi:hypothetical protein
LPVFMRYGLISDGFVQVLRSLSGKWLLS